MMTIPFAITILQDLLTCDPQFPPEDRIQAVKLGIEALRRIAHTRFEQKRYRQSALTGEKY